MERQPPVMPEGYSDEILLKELAPTAERLLNRHLATAKEWMPHEFVPWSRGRDFIPGEEWDENEFMLPQAMRSALFVNLLTEDNLPYYSSTIDRMFGRDSAWGTWTHRWTAEEMRHAIVIRDYLTVSRAIDPVRLERARMKQVSRGEVPEPETAADGLVYVTLQELATRISHRNTGKLLASQDSAGYELMARVAADENLHFLFYRDTTTEAIQINPSAMVTAMARQVLGFAMPGTGIENFAHHAKLIAKAGIYDYQLHHDLILQPVVMKHWDLEHINDLSPEAEHAREQLLKFIGRLGIAAKRAVERKAEQEIKR